MKKTIKELKSKKIYLLTFLQYTKLKKRNNVKFT